MKTLSEKEEIRSTIEQFFQAMDSQNFELMKRLFPENDTMVHVGTDTGEIWKGSEELIKTTKKQFQNLDSYDATIRNLTINLSSSGDVGWYFHLLDARIQSGGRETVWEGARFTGVVEKHNGEWFLAQTHVSIPESA